MQNTVLCDEMVSIFFLPNHGELCGTWFQFCLTLEKRVRVVQTDVHINNDTYQVRKKV
jgi:hypothetical protein